MNRRHALLAIALCAFLGVRCAADPDAAPAPGGDATPQTDLGPVDDGRGDAAGLADTGSDGAGAPEDADGDGAGVADGDAPPEPVVFVFPPGLDPADYPVSAVPAADYPADPLLVPGTVWTFEPEGTQFPEPIDVLVRYAEAAIPAGYPEAFLRLHRLTDGAWVPVAGTGVYPDTDQVVTPLDGFSTYAVLAVTATSGRMTPEIRRTWPETVCPGKALTIQGHGFSPNPDENAVMFGWPANTVSPALASEDQLEVLVPDGIPCGPEPRVVQLHVTSYGQQSASVRLVLQEEPLAPPLIAEIRFAHASPGDRVQLGGYRFAPTAADNVVEVCGTPTRADSYTEIPHIAGYAALEFTVPAVAGVCELRVRRESDGSAWSGPVTLTVEVPTALTLALGPFGSGALDPCTGRDRPGAEGSVWCVGNSWLLTGAGFSRLRDSTSAVGSPAGTVDVTVESAAGRFTISGRALDDERLVVPVAGGGLPGNHLEAAFAGLAPGDPMQVSVCGYEQYNLNQRCSNAITLHVEHLLRNGYLSVPASLEGLASDVPMAQGDHLCIAGLYREASADHDLVTAPDLFAGTLPFAEAMRGWDQQALSGLCFLMDTAGRYPLGHAGSGRAVTVDVRPEGVVGGGSEVVRPGADAGDTVVAFGGARVTIPAGALPELAADATYAVLASHIRAAPGCFDPQQDASGHAFELQFEPEPAELLAPIRVALPFDPAGRAEPPQGALYDAETALYWELPSSIDTAQNRVVFELPAGRYAPSGDKDATPPGAIPPVGLNRVTQQFGYISSRSVRSVAEDPHGWFRVDFVTDPASADFVSEAYALQVLDTLVAAHTTLTAAGFTAPGWKQHVRLRDYGDPGAYLGSTERRWFGYGQPVVYVNTRLAKDSAKLLSTVAHETGHVFQRVVTTPQTTKWIDEAVAEWAAFATVGTSHFYTYSLSQSVPWTRTLPDGFWLGYDDEQAYAAGAFAIWFADTYGQNRMAQIYAALAASTLAWYDSYGTLETVAGEVFGWVYDRFARDYWTQAFDPVRDLDIDSALAVQTGAPHPRFALASFDGVSVREAAARPAMSSVRYTVDVDMGFWPTVLGRDLVARASVIGEGGSLLVYGDPVCPTSGLAGLVELARLTADARGRTIGRGGDYPCYRLVFLNTAKNDARDIAAFLGAPQLDGLTPERGLPAGGYPVTLTGRGFGDGAPQVHIGGFPQTVTAHSDRQVVVTMFNAGTYEGTMDVTVTTAEGARSNARPFTFAAAGR